MRLHCCEQCLRPSVHGTQRDFLRNEKATKNLVKHKTSHEMTGEKALNYAFNSDVTHSQKLQTHTLNQTEPCW